MNDPQVTADIKRYVKLSKDYKDLQPIVEATKKYKRLLDCIAGSKDLRASEKDKKMRELAKEELYKPQNGMCIIFIRNVHVWESETYIDEKTKCTVWATHPRTY